ncbi:recombinase family protein [Vibrio panuliri]|uniref:Recombinase n=1 Tax=Vibrio panuliri TaxID=1381081 RepID=A0ABX3F313_9VIBR|nr:recombinase family protein [Vibrio panuliri]KAB1458242.1 recombinase family protein [Vibrio panuliri]OLQ84066.1 recombinase [Vibrio panuliri]
MTHYLYTRFSPNNQAYQQHLTMMLADLPEATHVEDKVRGFVPPLERPAFSQLFEQLQSGDTVVIWWLTAFGKDFSQVNQTVKQLLDKGVHLQLMCEPLRFSPDSPQTDTLLSLLIGYEKVQTMHRLFAAEQGRKALKGNPDAWQQKFRGRPADRAKHKQIATLLLEGYTLQKVAEQCDVSLSTVKRVKAKLKQIDDEGGLRRRGRCHQRGGDES